MNKITIHGKEYNLKYTIRSLFIFEQITGHPFKIETTMDNYIFFYSLILANNRDNPLLWDEFCDAIDEDPHIVEKIAELVANQNKLEEQFGDEDKTMDEQKKS